MFAPSSGTREDPSALKGPRGSATAMTFMPKGDLRKTSGNARPLAFTKYGKVSQTVFGGSDKYDYIDTIVYIQGMMSTATTQIPIRIIRYAGS